MDGKGRHSEPGESESPMTAADHANGYARSRRRLTWARAGALALVPAMTAVLAAAQASGPLRPPPPAPSSRPPVPVVAEKPEALPMPPEEIIRRFAANEEQILRAIMGYSFERSIRVEELGPDNKPIGQVESVTQHTPGPDGRPSMKVIRRAQSTLQYVELEPRDLDGAVSTPLFPLVPSQLANYEIRYEGKQPLDELSAYYFSVRPRALNRTRAFFSGVVWVDEQDLVIVKSIGKWISETGEVKVAQLPFIVFETYRQQVAKNLWFPAYSRSDEPLQADAKTSVPMRMTIRWSHYALPPEVPAAPAASPAPPAPVPSP